MTPAVPDDGAMTDTAAVIDQYNAAFLKRAPEESVDAASPTEDPDGAGTAGQRTDGVDRRCPCRLRRIASDAAIQFTVERVDIDGDRAVIRWRITGTENYRGVNLIRVRDGKIIEALGYGKRP